MNAAQRFGWTLDDLHERIGACDALVAELRLFEPDDERAWGEAAPLPFIRLADEAIAWSKDGAVPVPATTLRRLRRLDNRLEPREVVHAAERLRAWLARMEGELGVGDDEPDDGEAAVPEADNLVSLPSGAAPADRSERMRGLRTERWVAVPPRTEVRERTRAARETLLGFALVVGAANAEDAVPLGALDRRRLALVTEAARHMLNGPLAELGLLRSVRENAALLERTARTPEARTTAKRARVALEVLATDLG